MKPTNGLFGAHAIACPGGAGVFGLDQGKAIAIGPLKAQALRAHPGLFCQPFDPKALQPVCPPAQAALWHGKPRYADFARTRAAPACVWKGKIGHHRAGRAHLVAVIQVVDLGCIKIDGFFHPAQTQHLCEKIIIFLRPRCNRGDVM